MNLILITNFKLNLPAAYNAAIVDISKKGIEKRAQETATTEGRAPRYQSSCFPLLVEPLIRRDAECAKRFVHSFNKSCHA
jgi:hypothetical protein